MVHFATATRILEEHGHVWTRESAGRLQVCVDYSQRIDGTWVFGKEWETVPLASLDTLYAWLGY